MGKRRKRGDKGDRQLAHAKRRLLARYGLTLDISDIRFLGGKIRRAHTTPAEASGVYPECLGRQSNRLTIWAVSYRGQVLTLVYDSIRHTIVTALPPGTGLPGGAPVKSLVCKKFEEATA